MSGIAFIDFFSCTFNYPDDDELQFFDNIQHFLHDLLLYVFNIDCAIENTERGYFGYTTCLKLGVNGELGIVAFGGESQRGTVFLSLTGAACNLIDDWATVREWGEKYAARITRVDLAHDDFEGHYLNFEKVESWYLAGDFVSKGHPPKARAINDYGSNEGRTLYIGKRQNGKMFRGYEKGKQLGDLNSLWFRIEVEFRNKDRVIPWDILTSPGRYLAGSYPCLNFISLVQSKIKTVKKSAQITYERVLSWLRTAAGPALDVLAEVHSGDIYQLFSLIARPCVPERMRAYREHLHLIDPIT